MVLRVNNEGKCSGEEGMRMGKNIKRKIRERENISKERGDPLDFVWK